MKTKNIRSGTVSKPQKQKKNEILQMAEEWQRTFDTINSAVWILDKDQRIIQSNKTAEIYFKRKLDKIIGKKCWEVVHGTTQPISDCPIIKVKKSLKRETANLKIGEHWFEVTVDPMLDADGRFNGAVHIVSDITDQKQAEEAIIKSEQKYRHLFDKMTSGYAIHEIICNKTGKPVDYRFLSVNAAFEKQTGLYSAAIVGRTVLEIIPDLEPIWIERYGKVALTREPIQFENYTKALDKTFEIRAFSPEPGKFATIFNDITDRKRTETHLNKLNRIYSVLSNVNQMIIRINEPRELFQTACNIAVKHGGFRMAWIGLLDQETKHVKPVAHAGITNGYLQKLNITLDDSKRSLGPTATALKAGKYEVVNDIANDPRMAPWRDDALRLGYRSSAAFPLIVEGKVSGTINLYAPEPDFFDDEELKLLEEMADDIAFSMEYSEHEKKRIQAEDALQKSEQQLDTMLQTMIEGMVTVDITGQITYSNQSAQQILGIGKDILGKYYQSREWHQIDDQGKPYHLDQLPLAIVLREHRKVTNVEHLIIAPDGEKKWLSVNAAPLFDHAGQFLGGIASFRDITENKHAKKQQMESEIRYRRLFETAKDGILILDAESGNIIDANPFICEKLGNTLEDIQGKKLWELGFLRDAGISNIAFDELKKNRYIRYENLPLQTKDGEVLQVEFISNMYLVNSTEVIQCNIRDITDRKRAEEALLASKEYAENLIQTANAMIIGLNNHGDIIVFNKTAEKITGYKQKELEGKSWFEVLVPRERYPEVWEEFIQLKGGRIPKEFENPILTKSGEERFIVWHNNVLREKGQITGTISFGIDITERKQTEEKLRNSEAFLNNIIDQNPYGYWISDDKGNLIRINQACCELLNITESDVVGKYNVIKDNIVKEQGMLPLVQSVFTKGETVRFEINYNTSKLKSVKLQQQASVILDTTVFPIKDISGKVINAVIQHVNITGRKQTEKELQNYHDHLEELVKERTIKLEKANFDLHAEINERKRIEEELDRERNMLKTLIDNIPDEIYAKDRESKFIMANSHVIKSLWKKKPEEVINKTDFDVLPYEQALKYYNDEQVLLKSNKQIINYETSRCEENGEIHWYSVTKVPLLDSEKKISGLVGINRDISMFKLAEESYKKAKEAAEAANIAKSTFLSSMSHEIRTPLNAILGFSQLILNDKNLTSDQKEFLETINRSGEHLLNLINDILEISKIEAGRAAFNPSVFNLHSIINDIDTMFRIKTDAKQLALLIEYPEDLPKFIVTDEGKLRQILINIVGNAIKFTTEGGIAIRIRVDNIKNNKSVLIIEVEDTGPGIGEKDTQKLFQMFGQAESGIKEGGTGLGLVISREYARMMDGDITVNSKINIGSCFTIKIIIEKNNEVLPVRKARKKRVIGLESGQKYKVLIVDDQMDNRALLNKILISVGFEVNEAKDGMEAVEKYKSWSPDIIIMDMRMPVMDGYEATRIIKAIDEKIPIIAVTASAFYEDRVKALEAGADKYLRKPFKGKELFENIKTHLGVRYIYEKDK